MESSDLSLFEIGEEDDSLLLQSPIVSDSTNLLSCSPLLRSRYSPLVHTKTDENEAKVSALPPHIKLNKENSAGANNSGAPSLCNEPQQMKRRKKGGGYNLRKSIAWNKAFFTDEGVLDPSELSMITGGLCSIQEEGSNPLSKIPASIHNKGNGSLFTSKYDTSPRDKGAPTFSTPRKVLSFHDVNRNRCSPGGSSSILASSSKRPPVGRITRAVAKESKLPKFPVLKPDTKSVSAARRSTTNGNSVAKRALTVQKDVGFKASSSSRRVVETDIKRRTVLRSIPAKAPVPSYRKDMSKSTRSILLSKDVQPPKNPNANITPGLTRNPVLTGAATQVSNIQQISSNSEITSHQNQGHHSSENEQSAQPQVSKPSSLRMPSPSLGFFGQPKASGSQVSMAKGTLPCNVRESGIPKVPNMASKVSDPKVKVKPPCAPAKIIKVAKESSLVKSLSTPSSIPSAPAKTIKVTKENSPVKSLSTTSSVPSSMKVVYQDNLKPKLDSLVVDNPSTILKDTCDDAVKRFGVREANVVHGGQQTGYKCYNSPALDSVAIAEAQLEATTDTIFDDQGVCGSNARTGYDDHGQSESTTSCFGEDNRIPSERNQGTGTSNFVLLQESRPSKSSPKIDLENISSKDLVVASGDSRSCDGLPRYVEQEKESSEIEISSVKLSGAARVESIDCNLLADSCSRELSTLIVGKPHILAGSVNENMGEPLQPINPCVIEKDIQVLHPNDIHGSELKSVHITSHFTVDTQVNGNCGLNCSSNQLQSEDNAHNLSVNSESVFSESLLVDMSSCSCEDASIPTCDDGVPYVDKQSVDQAELRKACDSGTCKINLVENAELQKHGIGNDVDTNWDVQPSIECKFDISQPCSQIEYNDQANGGPAKVHDIADELPSVENCLEEHDSPNSLDDSRHSEVELTCIVDESKAEHIDVDQCEFAASNCRTFSETEADKADQIFSIPPRTNDAGVINNEDTNVRLSCVRDLPESESLVEDHTFVTNNFADANPQVEADISPLFSQLECIDQSNEEAAKIHEIADESYLVDADESSLHNQLVKDYTDNLTSSVDHASTKCWEDSKQSEKNFESSCNVDEPKKHIDVDGSEIVALNCGRASETEVKGADLIASVPQEMIDSVINLVRDEMLIVVGNLPDSEPLVEDHSFVIDTPVGNSFELKNRAAVNAENLEQFHSLNEEPELIMQTSSGKAQSDGNLIDGQEIQELQNNNDSLFNDTISDDISQLEYNDQANGGPAKVHDIGDELPSVVNSLDEHDSPNSLDDSRHSEKNSEVELTCFVDESKAEHIDVDQCEFVASNCRNSSETEADSADQLFSIPPRTIDAGVINNEDTNGRLSCVRDLPESESLVEDHTFVTNNFADANPQVEADISPLFSQLECIDQSNEEAAKIHEIADESYLVDADESSLHNQLVKDYTDNLTSSVDHASTKCWEDSKQSEKNFESSCNVDEPKKHIDVDGSEIVALNCGRASETEVKGADLIASVPQEMIDSVINLVRDEMLIVVGNLPDSEPLVEDHSFVIDTPVGNSFELKNRAAVNAENLEQFHSLNEEPELIMQTSSGKAQSDGNLIDGQEIQELQNNNDSLFNETISDDISQLEYNDQANGGPAKVHDIGDELPSVVNSLDEHDSPNSLDDSRHSEKNSEVELTCFVDESKAEHIDVDQCEFVASNCRNSSETEADSADQLFSIPPRTIDAGVINNEDTNGRLSCVRDLPESESLVEDHTFVTNNFADANPQVEADISPLFSQLECIDQSNEEAAKIHEIADESYLVDADESSLHNQLVKDYTDNLTSSVDHASTKCWEDSKQSEKNFESSCNVDEPKKHIDVDGSEIVALNCGRASETEVKGADLIASVPQEMIDSVINLVRDEMLIVVGNLPDSEPLVEDHSFVIDTPVGNSFELKNRAAVNAENLEQFHSLNEEPELIMQTSSGKAQSDGNLIDGQEIQELQNNNDSLFNETISDDISQLEYNDQANGGPAKVHDIGDELPSVVNSLDEHDSPNSLDDSRHSEKNSEVELTCFVDESKAEHIDVDQCEFVVSNCRNSSETEADSADQLFSIPPRTIDAGVINNEDTNGRLSCVRDLPESESLVEDHTFVTNNFADANPQVEADISPLFSQLECIDQSNEEAAKIHEIADESYLVDADESSLHNQLVEDYTDKLTSSVDHAYPKCWDDSMQSEKNFESSCNVDESKKHIDVDGSGIVALNCASETEVKGADLIASVPQEMIDSVINLVRDDTLVVVGNLPDSEPLVEDHSFVIDTPIGNSFELKNRAAVNAENLEQFHSLDEEPEPIIQASSGKAQSDGNLIDGQELQNNNDSLFNKTRSDDEVQKENRDDIENRAAVNAENLEQFHSLDEEPEPIIQASSGKAQSDGNLIDGQESQELQNNNDSLFNETRSDDEVQKENRDDIDEAGLVNGCSTLDQAAKCAGDKQVKCLDYNLITESLQYKQISTAVTSQLKGAIDDAKEDRGQVSINSPEVSRSSPDSHLSLYQSSSGQNNKSLVDGEYQTSDMPNAEPTNMYDLSTAATDKDETTQRSDSEIEMKDGGIVIKIPTNAAPFSDEWLAAMEAAGEDILAQKTGAVQHSPTEKSIAEPGPWSPVKKKKNHEIGPFDCTKYTNV